MMSQQDLSAGLTQLNGRFEQADKLVTSTAIATAYNADLWNALVLRVNQLEAGANLLAPKTNELGVKTGEMEKHVLTTSGQMGEMEQYILKISGITARIDQCFELVHAKDVASDTKLQHETDVAVQKLDEAYGKLQKKTDLIEQHVRSAASQHRRCASVPSTRACRVWQWRPERIAPAGHRDVGP